MKLQIKVIPSSSKDCISGWLGDSLKIKVKAPADRGKANKAVIKIIENTLSLPAGCVNIESGLTTSRKIISINGYDKYQITDKLATVIK